MGNAADMMQAIFDRPSGNKLTDNVQELALATFLTCVHTVSSTGDINQQLLKSINSNIDTIQGKVRFWLKQKLLHCKESELQSGLKVSKKVSL